MTSKQKNKWFSKGILIVFVLGLSALMQIQYDKEHKDCTSGGCPLTHHKHGTDEHENHEPSKQDSKAMHSQSSSSVDYSKKKLGDFKGTYLDDYIDLTDKGAEEELGEVSYGRKSHIDHIDEVTGTVHLHDDEEVFFFVYSIEDRVNDLQYRLMLLAGVIVVLLFINIPSRKQG
jgi:hypothetical protein